MERVMQEVVLPALKKLVFDRTAVLRKELGVVVAQWLKQDRSQGFFFKVRSRWCPE